MSSSSFASTSVFEGSSSSSTTTIGAFETPPIVRAFASLGNASSEIWPLSRNSSRNTSGAGESTFRNERTGSARAQSTARPAPTSTLSAISRVSEASIDFLSACTAMRAERAPRNTMCAPWRTSGRIRPSSSSIASSSAGGSTTSSTEKLTMSKPDEPRAAKNSGLSLRRSKSGCATAKVQSTARLRYAQPAAFAVSRLTSDERSRAPECRTPGARCARPRRPP